MGLREWGHQGYILSLYHLHVYFICNESIKSFLECLSNIKKYPKEILLIQYLVDSFLVTLIFLPHIILSYLSVLLSL